MKKLILQDIDKYEIISKLECSCIKYKTLFSNLDRSVEEEKYDFVFRNQGAHIKLYDKNLTVYLNIEVLKKSKNLMELTLTQQLAYSNILYFTIFIIVFYFIASINDGAIILNILALLIPLAYLIIISLKYFTHKKKATNFIFQKFSEFLINKNTV